MREGGRIGPLEWAVAGRPLPGEDVSGDAWVACDTGGNSALFAVIDGLGHGADAAVAAQRAVAVITDNSGEPVDVLMLLCHEALTDTRGAAISLSIIRFDDPVLHWASIGNVSSSLVAIAPGGLETRAAALLTGGIVGYRMPSIVVPPAVPIKTGDLLIMASDGISGEHVDAVDPTKSEELIAAEILARRARSTDDAVALVARYRGTAA